MLSHAFYLLITCLATTLTSAIRVDWNTNKGPIVPPPPHTTDRPQPPYREPAPVWEAQPNDIPNPNPFVYVLPPPSRPRPATNNYLTSDRQPVDKINYNNNNKNHLDYGHNNNNNKNYGKVWPTPAETKYPYRPPGGNTNPVAAAGLAIKYVVPNVVKKYYAARLPGAEKVLSHSSTKPEGFYYGDKTQGKYNAKTKKFKVYEKIKHHNAMVEPPYVRLYNYRYI